MDAHRRHVAAFLLTSGLGISFLVFLNAGQAFVLNDLLEVPKDKTGRISGILVFSDELLALVMVLVWGRIADLTSPRLVSVVSNLIVALAFLLFVQVRNVFPQLLLARLLFASGSAGITAMLSALLSILSSPPSPPSPPLMTGNERQPLLGWARPPPLPTSPSSHRSATRLAALLGLCTGLGALLAVFLFLRLPNYVSPSDSKYGLRITFRLVAGVAILNALIAYVALPRAKAKAKAKSANEGMQTQKRGIMKEITTLGRGFYLAKKDRQVALGYVAGFVARAQNITVAAFIPLYVASYYRSHGLCDPSPGAGEDLKSGCHAAYSLASAITGTINLTALLLSPFLSFISSPSRTLTISSLIGGLSFFVLGRSVFHLGGEDPRNGWTWLAAVGIGMAQISAVVCSLAVVSRARMGLLDAASLSKGRIKGSDSEDDGSSIISDAASELVQAQDAGDAETSHEGEEEEIAGALAGAYSFCGGLGILFVSGLGSLLADQKPGISFILVAIVNVLLSIFAGAMSTA